MKQSDDVPWVVLVEVDDTPQDVADWLESHCILTDGTIMKPGDINVGLWEIEPRPGDVIMTNSAPLSTIRFGGFIVRHDGLEEKFTQTWFEPVKHETVVNAIVNMLTRIVRRKRNEKME